jgi:signal transduction histidine kinase
MLHQFISANRDELIRRCRAKVAERSVPPATPAELDHGVPLFLSQLCDALRASQKESPEIVRSATQHGHDLLRYGFSLSQVVHDYGDVCQAVTELALKLGDRISTDDFRVLNRCLDEAIAGAVTEFSREQNQATLDEGTKRAGFLTHELRNLLHTALAAFDVLKTGNVGVGGSTGAVLRRSLLGARDLIARSVAEIRLTQQIQDLSAFRVSLFIEEVATDATLAANARGINLCVNAADDEAMIEADRQVLVAVVMNLLQNAIKFTHAHSTITLRVGASPDRVLIEIEDECGGLPGGDVHGIFRPYEQRASDRTGLGLGLAFARWGAEANRGRLYARNLPEQGCVFTVDLPRLPSPAVVC